MKRKFSISGLLFNLVVALIALAVGTAEFGLGAGIVAFVVLFLLPLLPLPSQGLKGLSFMAVTKEVWQDHIEGNLFKNNEFLLSSVDESQYVLEGKVVHIPQAGGTPTISVNAAFGPVTVVQRTDTDITYNLDVYSSQPIGITNAEEVELSYDKRESILSEHEDSLNQTIADYILTKWSPVGNIIRTTGIMNNDANSAPVVVPAATPIATGQRLKFGLYDLKAIKTKLDNANIPANDRYGILNVDMYNQLVDDLILSKYRETSLTLDEATGEIKGRLLGFKIFMRSSVVTYNNAATPVLNAYGSAGATTDNAAGLFWQRNAVGRAKGPTLFYEQIGNPIYQADIYSLMQRMGARIRRVNEENIVAIVQTAA